jgi:uncharacterized phage protein (TIGR01671 family)
MRELKFKFWNKLARRFQAPNKYAIQGDGLYVSYDYDMMAWDDPSSFDDSILVPCQYIGYKDSEDKEVYENDIVEVGFGEHKGVLGKIIFEYGCFMIESRYNAIFQDSYKSIKYGKVVGNIFENNDLLKQ